MVRVSQSVRTYPSLPYREIARAVLGSRYELSLTFVGEDRARMLNRTYRKKTYVPNVLSFPLTRSAGEVYICPAAAKREAKKYDMSLRGYVGFLLIHALLHLSGYRHGDTMEKAEKKYCQRFNLK